MAAFAIEKDGEIKERFSFERPLSADTRHALLQYARANYGADATLRRMNEEEAADFRRHADAQPNVRR